MRLGKLISALERFNPEHRVLIENVLEPLEPQRLRSYRGYYSDLAIEPRRPLTPAALEAGHVEPPPMTVGAFLEMLRAAVGQKFEGYKGGSFTMSESTPVWVSEWGASSGYHVDEVYEDVDDVYLGIHRSWER